MKKGHYHGGGTLVGFGKVSKAKGRRGGIGDSGAAVRVERQSVAKKQERELAQTIKSNEKVIERLGREWAAEKGRQVYESIVKTKRIKVSPLAAALDKAISRKIGDDDV